MKIGNGRTLSWLARNEFAAESARTILNVVRASPWTFLDDINGRPGARSVAWTERPSKGTANPGQRARVYMNQRQPSLTYGANRPTRVQSSPSMAEAGRV
jgi:hypothetical protein